MYPYATIVAKGEKREEGERVSNIRYGEGWAAYFSFVCLAYKWYFVLMYLKELELHGFKSFAKKTKLSFDSTIVAIVGPNGSGKSNIAEAMRFVLGEQSRDAMRAKRGEDLIWNGSKNVARLGKAGVTLTCDNSQKVFGNVFDLDYPEVILSREVHRDGVSEYFINGTRARLRDVLELLASAHIGSSAHHIISQGETDRILIVSAKERREMIEDALGLRSYEYKIAESEKKLENTEENLKEIGLLRKELAPRMQVLKKQMERVERAQSLREELASAAREYFAREKFYFDREKEAIRVGGAMPNKELGEIEMKVREIRKKLEAPERREENKELLSLEARSRELREKRDVLSRKVGRVEGMIELEEDREREQKELGNRGEKEREALIPIAKVRAFSGIVRGLLDEALVRDSLADVKETLARLKETSSGFLAGVEEKYAGETSAREESRGEGSREATLQALKIEKEEMVLEMEELQVEETKNAGQIEELRRASEEKREAGRGAEKELFELLSRERELTILLETLQQREDDRVREEREWKAEQTEVAILAGREAVEFEHFLADCRRGRREEGSRARDSARSTPTRNPRYGVQGGRTIGVVAHKF